jgi:AcrR family transcriptional regulator
MADGAQAAERLAAERDRLPPGRHGLPRDFVAENQRERLLNGMVEAVAERGYNATTIGRIAAAAKISRRTFYEHFAGKEDCFLAAYEVIDEHVRGEMVAATEGEPWPERVRARLAVLVDVLSRDPAVARFYLAEPLSAGGEIAVRYREAMRLVAELLRSDEAPVGMDLELRDQALMGGVTALIRRRLDSGDAARLRELLPDLTELALVPWLGREEAKRYARGGSP